MPNRLFNSALTPDTGPDTDLDTDPNTDTDTDPDPDTHTDPDSFSGQIIEKNKSAESVKLKNLETCVLSAGAIFKFKISVLP
jgi:hypothetical protein